MTGIDLSLFQFDFDLTLAAVMLEPDGTILARYDARVGAEASTDDALPALEAALEGALDLHARLEEVRPSLAAKRGRKPRHRLPEEIPAPSIRKARERSGARGCIHCHQVYEHDDAAVASRPDYAPVALAKHPSPETIGLTLSPRDGRTIIAVAPGSAAAGAGIEAGGILAAIDGVPVVSLADVRFALHHVPDPGTVALTVRADGTERTGEIALATGWKADDFSWRASMFPMPPAPGLWVTPLAEDDERRGAGLAGRLALEVRGVFGEKVKRAGLAKGDVIVAIDGHTEEMSEQRFHAYVRSTHYRKGSTLKLVVRRRGRGGEVPLDVVF